MLNSKGGSVRTAIDRRTFVRVPFHKAVTITTTHDGRTVDGTTIDVSLGGVGIVTSAGGFSDGQTVVLSFRIHDPRRGVVVERVSGRVANFRAHLDGNRMGVEFFAPLNEVEQPGLAEAVNRL